ncbi:MAG: hypothetical protein ACRYGA_00405 [Janthinobacterium lividum]
MSQTVGKQSTPAIDYALQIFTNQYRNRGVGRRRRKAAATDVSSHALQRASHAAPANAGLVQLHAGGRQLAYRRLGDRLEQGIPHSTIRIECDLMHTHYINSSHRRGMDCLQQTDPPVAASQMSKLIILPVGLALTLSLVWGFGLASVAICFALALASLLFSTEAGERDREIAS